MVPDILSPATTSPLEFDFAEGSIKSILDEIALSIIARRDELAASSEEIELGKVDGFPPHKDVDRSFPLSVELQYLAQLVENGIAVVGDYDWVYDLDRLGPSLRQLFSFLSSKEGGEYKPTPITQVIVLRDKVTIEGFIDLLLAHHVIVKGGSLPDYLQQRFQKPPRTTRLMARNLALSPAQLKRLNAMVFPNVARRIAMEIKETVQLLLGSI